jgi:peroxiredoxin
MLKLGTKAPEFSLPDVVSGKIVTLLDFENKKALLVMFICCHCPYVKHIQNEIVELGVDYKNKDLGIVAISANDVETHPGDSPDNLKKQAQELNFSFPYLYDETQEVAKVYTAACTPDFFLFGRSTKSTDNPEQGRRVDNHFKLVYRGQLDDARPGKVWVKVTGRDLRNAIDAVLSDKPVSKNQKPSAGCNIKWKSGNEPKYFF